MLGESVLERAALEWYKELGYEVAYGPDISPGGLKPERDSYSQVLLLNRLRQALLRINPTLPEEAIEKAVHKLIHIAKPTLEETNRAFHSMLRNGVSVRITRGKEKIGEIVKLFDFEDLNNNDWLVVNQFKVIEGEYMRIPDIVIFINGIPIGLIELKDPGDPRATVRKAYNKLQNYKREIPSLFYYNEIIVLSDDTRTIAGTITTSFERFSPWKTIHGKVPPREMTPLEIAIRGMFDKVVVLELVRDFIAFEYNGARWQKMLAWYNQYDAVKEAIKRTLIAYRSRDKRIGIIWHAQGAGKSLEMVFYVGKLLRIPELKNPTILVLTDRNDLDNQIYEKFEAVERGLIPYPKQAETVEHLKELLKVPAGGIIFSTVQKFKAEEGRFPLLSKRENIIVIADEAHRSHYNFIQGYARYIREGLPNATFIGFTATPIELGDRSTVQVFGDYIHIYDLAKAEEDGVTVPIIYENRWAKIGLESHAKEFLDKEFEEITEREEVEVKEKLKKRWSRLERVLGSESVLKKLAKDIVEHFERRCEAIEGKALIACMSRRICVDLYNHIIKLRPEWHNEDDRRGVIKVLMTGSTDDPLEYQPHIRNKYRRDQIKKRFADPSSPLKILLVRDMLLTGFDCPCLHTIYVYKPMRGHTLIQAITRVNRVYKDKPAGLVVDYVGIGEALKMAVVQYAKRAPEAPKTFISQEDALPILMEKYEEVRFFLRGIDYSRWRDLSPQELMRLFHKAHNEIVRDDDTKRRFLRAVSALKKAFVLATPHPEALKLKDDIAFFEELRGRIIKASPEHVIPPLHVDTALKRLVGRAVILEDIVDLLSESMVKPPKLPILSEEFLKEVSEVEFPNLRIELLRKLLNDEIRVRMRRNIVRYQSFKERLERTIKAYHNRAIGSAKVMEELIKIARELRESIRAGEELGLTEEELAFYDALSRGEKFIASDEELKKLVKKLVETIKKNLSIDWTEHENVKSKVRASVKRLLRRHGFSPVRYPMTIDLIMKQAEALYRDWPTIEFEFAVEPTFYPGQGV
jgi:type I restriction enzyme R subunit